MHPDVHSNTIHNNQDRETTKMFNDKWMDIEDAAYTYTCVNAQSLQSHPTLCDSMDYTPSGSCVQGILPQECWSGLPCPPPGIFPAQGSSPRLLCLLHCGWILDHWATGEALYIYTHRHGNIIKKSEIMPLQQRGCNWRLSPHHVKWVRNEDKYQLISLIRRI